MFTNILVPIDGSENSYKALQCGAEIAERFKAKLTVLHVIPLTSRTIGITSASSVTLLESLIQELKTEGEGYIAKAKTILNPFSIEYDTKMSFGSPAQEIAEKAADKYDLIVIGSRGMGEVKGLFLGSVSDRVTHISKQPVLVVH